MCGVKMNVKKKPRTYELAGFKEYFGWTSNSDLSAMV